MTAWKHPLLVDGVTHFPTIYEFLEAGRLRWPDTVWLRTPDGHSTRDEVFKRARRIAGGLRARGVRPGDRVVIVLPNSQDFIDVWVALILLRVVMVAVHIRSTTQELDAVVRSLEPAAVVARAEASLTRAVVTIGELLTAEPIVELPAKQAQPDDEVAFIQSSGSTGEPKFVIQTNSLYSFGAEGLPYWLGLSSDDVMLTALPLTHVNAQVYSVLGSWGIGAELVLLPRFSASTFWADVARYGATEFNAIGAMVEALMAHPRTAEERENTVRLCYSAPTPTEERHRDIEERFGLRLVMGYGLSESTYGMVVPTDGPNQYGTMGRPRQHPELGKINDARVVDAEGRLRADGELGELELRSPAMTPGYFRNAEATAALYRDGWLRTGDLAIRRADGFFVYGGRTKEIIRVGGENLSPVEVENIIDKHPAVSQSAAIGVPSARTEEDIKVFVQIRSGAEVNAEELAEWCAERLVPFKRPRYVEFVDSWPLTETSKIAKRELPTGRTSVEIDMKGERHV